MRGLLYSKRPWLNLLLPSSWLSLPSPCFKPWSWHHMDMEATTTINNITALEASRAPNARHSARGGAVRPSTISHACSSVRNAARNACVCPQGIMGTKLCALATTTGRPRKEDPSALEESFPIFLPLSLFPT